MQYNIQLKTKTGIAAVRLQYLFFVIAYLLCRLVEREISFFEQSDKQTEQS